MKLKHHIICGSIVSGCLFPVYGFLCSIFWVASILMDIDHYIEFLFKNKFSDFSLKRMFSYSNTITEWIDRPELLGLNIFHTIEVIGGIYLTSIWLDLYIIKVVCWGMLFHLLCDMFYLYRSKKLFVRSISIIEYFIRKKLMINNGILPDAIFEEALLVAGVDISRKQKDSKK